MKYQKLLEKQNKHKKVQEDQITVKQLDVILIDNCGCELARETTTPQKDIYSIIKNWVLIPGDTIKIEEFWHEEQ